MAKQEFLTCQVTSDKKTSSRVQKSCRATWFMAVSILVALAQPMWAVAGPPDHAQAVFMDGEVDMIHIDEVIPEKSRFAYFLHPKGSVNGRDAVEMIFEGDPPKGLRTGKKVKIKGRAGKGKVWVSEIAALDGGGSGASSNSEMAAAATGDRKTITFVINMDGVDYAAKGVSPYTQSHVDSSGKAMHDTVSFSVHGVYKEASFDQVTFSGSAASDVFLVSIPYDPDEACAYYTIAADADAASPVNINNYQHRLYVVPPKAISGCGWLALGQVGSYGSTSVRKSWSTRIDPIAFAHELGHNIGWHHAATDPDNDGTKNVEYGDTSDLMGYCCSKRKLNSVHMDQAGWFDAQNLQAKVVEVKTPGQYMLVPLGTDPGMSSEPQILKIIPTSGRPYYLSYRQKTGMDMGMSSTYTTGVNIHRGEKTNNWSYLVKVLKTDSTDLALSQFHDADNELTISQVENNENFVKVDISFGGECVVGNTQVALAPSSQEVNSLTQTPSYTLNITNNDTAACDATNYQVSLAPMGTGITGTVQGLTVNPQSQGSTTVTFGLGDVANGMYAMTLDVSDQDVNEPMHAAQATGSLNVNVPTCVVGAPTVSMTPTSQIVTEDNPLQPYTLTVTNNDSSACPATDWSVALSSSSPSGTVMDSVLHNVGPGASAMTTVNMDVTGLSNGVYPIMVNVSDAAHAVQSASASLELSMGVCVIGAPTVELTPSQQLVSDVSDLQAYMLKVTNNDSAFCESSSWSVAVTSDLESAVATPLNVAPGGFGMTAVNMNVTGAADGSYPITVTVSDGKAEHAGQVGASLQLDMTAPTPPAGVAAQLNGKGRNKSVQVSWNQASDGSGGTGVASYTVYRNGTMLGSTTSMNFKDLTFSTTVPNVYEIFAVDQVGHISTLPGTVTYTYSGGGGSKGGKGKKK